MHDDDCPDCGGPLSLGGRFCKACGWDADLEESEDAYLDGVEIPDAFTDEDYEAFVDSERLAAPSPRRLLWIVVALIALAAFLLAYVF